jgi:Domain of unknown function (DUF4411)
LRYSIDTSSLSNGWQKLYPPDVFGGVWQRLDGVIRAGIVVATEEVLIELERGDEDLFKWVKEREEMFLKHNEEIQVSMSQICARHPKLVDVARTRSMCDPWVIAVAQVNGLTVVSEENSRPARPKIPDVCQLENIGCIRLLEMIRQLGWQFS